MSVNAIDRVSTYAEICSVSSEVNENRLVVNETPADDCSRVTATLTDCQESQVGPRYVAESMTFVIGDSRVHFKELEGLSNGYVEYFETHAGDITSGRKKQLYFKRTVLSFVIILFIVLSGVIAVETFNNKKGIESLKKAQFEKIVTIKTPNGNQSLHLTDHNTVFTEIRTTTDSAGVIKSMKQPQLENPHQSIKEVGGLSKTKSGTINISTIASAFQSSTQNNLVPTKNVNASTQSPNTTKIFDTVPHYNERILNLSKIYRSLSVMHPIIRSKWKIYRPFEKTKTVVAQFHVSICTSFTTCLRDIDDYPDVDFNFILYETILCETRGWVKAAEFENVLKILFMFRDSKRINEKMMYIYLLLINASVRCGYLHENFTVKITLDKFHKDTVGYRKFIDIIKASEKEKYFVDDKDSFVSDTVELSETLYKPCPIFHTCTNTCAQQDCLQKTCEEEQDDRLCFVQCL